MEKFQKIHYLNYVRRGIGVVTRAMCKTANNRERRDTVYSFEFAQSYFRSIEIWNWFAQSWIRPLPNFLILPFIYNSISPVLNLPSGLRAKRAEIKRGRKTGAKSLYTVWFRRRLDQWKRKVDKLKQWQWRNRVYGSTGKVCEIDAYRRVKLCQCRIINWVFS